MLLSLNNFIFCILFLLSCLLISHRDPADVVLAEESVVRYLEKWRLSSSLLLFRALQFVSLLLVLIIFARSRVFCLLFTIMKIGPIFITNNIFIILSHLLMLCDIVIYLIHLSLWDKVDFRHISSSDEVLNRHLFQAASINYD